MQVFKQEHACIQTRTRTTSSECANNCFLSQIEPKSYKEASMDDFGLIL